MVAATVKHGTFGKGNDNRLASAMLSLFLVAMGGMDGNILSDCWATAAKSAMAAIFECTQAVTAAAIRTGMEAVFRHPRQLASANKWQPRQLESANKWGMIQNLWQHQH